jgi:hypothetical protein
MRGKIISSQWVNVYKILFDILDNVIIIITKRGRHV